MDMSKVAQPTFLTITSEELEYQIESTQSQIFF